MAVTGKSIDCQATDSLVDGSSNRYISVSPSSERFAARLSDEIRAVLLSVFQPALMLANI